MKMQKLWLKPKLHTYKYITNLNAQYTYYELLNNIVYIKINIELYLVIQIILEIPITSITLFIIDYNKHSNN